jgi:hypothetical protein
MTIKPTHLHRRLFDVALALMLLSVTGGAHAMGTHGRPSLDDCAAALTPGRVWHADFVFSKVDGALQDVDMGISDGTQDNRFQLQRAAHDYAECVDRALDGPDYGDGRLTSVELTGRMAILSGRDQAAKALSNTGAKPSAQNSKPRPHVPDCAKYLGSAEAWKIEANVWFTTDGIPKVKSWTLSNATPGARISRKPLKRFAKCIGDVLAVRLQATIK